MEFRQDSPHGVSGWLALLIAGMLVLGPLMGIGRTFEMFAAAEHQYPALAQMIEWSSFKTAEWIVLLVFCVISVYGGLGLAMKRTPEAVSRAKLVLWFNYPISIVVTGMIIPAAMLADSVNVLATAIPSLIAAMIALGIWTAYLNRSKRVRNTYGLSHPFSYEHSCAIANESSSDVEYDGCRSGAGRRAAVSLQRKGNTILVPDEQRTTVDDSDWTGGITLAVVAGLILLITVLMQLR